MNKTHLIALRLTHEEFHGLNKLAKDSTRSAYLRSLLDREIAVQNPCKQTHRKASEKQIQSIHNAPPMRRLNFLRGRII